MAVQFSIIIPCYNAARWIEATIQSVRQQTVPQSEIEIIVVDDGSKDDSVRCIQALQVANLRLIAIANHGVSYARNVGTAASRGEFIQYLDADDLLLPDALRRRRQVLLAQNADVAYGRYERLEEQADGTFVTASVAGQKMEEVNADPELAAFSSFWVPPVALLYRRTVVEKIGAWNRSLPVIQDARFLQDAAFYKARFAFVAEVLGVYRVHRAGSLSKRTLIFERDILKNAFQTEHRWKKNRLLTAGRTKYLAVSYQRSAEKLFGRDPARFRLAYRAHCRCRKFWQIGLADACAFLLQVCGVGVSRQLIKPLEFGVRAYRFLGRRLKILAA
jgi:glycosyltransferase involved in cell wall biosynthesis